jgi:probable DNA metabolism protein
MSIRYEYDGSFVGFLSACAAGTIEGLARRVGEGAAGGAAAQRELFCDSLPVATDPEPARSFYRALKRALSAKDLRLAEAAFLSGLPGIDEALARCLSRAAAGERRVFEKLAEPCVALAQKAARRATAEAHLYLGIVRFSELADGSLYSVIEPECDVLPLIADHFASRFPGYRWAILDLGRRRALLHEENRAPLLGEAFALAGGKGPELGAPPYAPGDAAVRAAWKRYFESVAIGERRNPDLQRAFIPKKHRKHMPEFEEARDY